MVSHVSPQCGDGIELKFRSGMSRKQGSRLGSKGVPCGSETLFDLSRHIFKYLSVSSLTCLPDDSKLDIKVIMTRTRHKTISFTVKSLQNPAGKKFCLYTDCITSRLVSRKILLCKY